MTPPAPDRYSRQRVLPQIGAAGQQALRDGTALLIGCGALGSLQAELLVRAGVGRVRLADRDVVELHNLQRQLLFDEEDAAARLPKAEAAARHLRRFNSEVRCEPVVVDVTAGTIGPLLEGVQVVLDATDNFATRYLVNDACVQAGIPWVYGGVLGSAGMMLVVRPGQGPCLRCLFPEMPEAGSAPSCDTAGVLGPAPAAVASLQAAAALRLLVERDRDAAQAASLVAVDVWDLGFRTIEVQRDPACPCCGERRFPFLEAPEAGLVVKSLCGQEAVLCTRARPIEATLQDVARRIEAAGEARVTVSGLLLTVRTGPYELLVFPDGRAIVRGTQDLETARNLYIRLIGE